MVSFKEFFKILLENRMGSTIMSVPIKELGMSSDLKDLPPRCPYGFWVDKSGNFIPVEEMEHWDVALDIRSRAEAYLDKNLSPTGMSPYEYLFNNGFMRVVKVNDDVYYETPQTDPTQAQKRFLDIMTNHYGFESARRDV